VRSELVLAVVRKAQVYIQWRTSCAATWSSSSGFESSHRREGHIGLTIMSAICPLRPGEPDCRDYLRTGRCKYGETCKYNHPPDVESGGGVKPADPSEPFPIRPTEPPCQYFLKHGTCKFGQTCKFNHPSGYSPMEDVGGSRGGSSLPPSGHLVFLTTNSSPAFMTTDVSSHLLTSSTSVQVLPQRPNEPNCIYYLRNGKCRYGATCKFHHPLDAPSRSNQLYHPQTANTRPTQSKPRDNIPTLSQTHQQSVQYATASTIPYLMSQRLQPIKELVRPQQPTHVLLPSGQIAVILDPQSLQNVCELNPQDRPKYYISQTDGSIGALPSKYQNSNPVPVISPMLTATTHSISNTTFDSCIDLNNAYHQGQISSQSPHKSGSAGSLSAYGSVDSLTYAHGDVEYAQQDSGQGPLEQGRASMGQTSFPQYSAWPIHQVLSQSNQPQVRRSPSSVDTAVRQRHITDLERTSDSAADYYWPSNGSLSSIRTTDHDIQAGGSHGSAPNYFPSQTSSLAGQVTHPSFTAKRNSHISLSSSSEQTLAMRGNKIDRQESPGNDEGLTMMTSALLTMIDRHDYLPGVTNASTQVDANVRERRPLARPPPGMMGPSGVSNFHPGYSSNFEEHTTPPGGEGYFLGGYDEQTSRSPPWDLFREDF
jgi:hypothetical protein